ncbi:hypothetical protein [Acinetobacter calcoaceticus]|uniref:hypothetical protein n=1 Tax=Acinetobacter calcoaceticus TaxID=471 RepID=UPI0028634AC6|nr:hypothetical protein [Acinetobacter calcoaceticus]MDR6796584.1 uncharacterized protein YdcH (DUF465 family) [Acinetobacter calcoaceticus]
MSESKKVCGIVMPISAIDGCDESHWLDVYEILKEAISMADFEGNLVSFADDVGIIQKRIIQNLYDNPIVVCDVSCKNPNVMFELGMRLAFDKPTIIVKDDITTYSFDTSPIEHLEYPRDLRFSKIVEFKNKLAHKIKVISQQAQTTSAYSPFLQHFGQFKVAKLDQKEVSGQEYIIDELKSIKASMARLDRRNNPPPPNWYKNSSYEEVLNNDFDICLAEVSEENLLKLQKLLTSSEFKDLIKDYEIRSLGGDHRHLILDLIDESNYTQIKNRIESVIETKFPSKRHSTTKINKFSG